MLSSSDITYKDIAGVAITRGFHTDEDHKWLSCGRQSNGMYKLLCSICNGVKEVTSLSGYTYCSYGICSNEHTLADGNMMAVACYGTKDYYKCKYCRYVASFDNNVEQNYVLTYADTTQHKCVNNVTGLGYTLYEPHDYNEYRFNNARTHIGICECGYEKVMSHWVKESEITGGRYGRCASCGALIDLGNDFVPVNGMVKVSVNGSYIRSDGIIVLVDEDVQAYLNGTLMFYHKDQLPETQ